MNVLLREDLRELASHWAHVLVEDRRLAADGIERFHAALREECDARMMLTLSEPARGWPTGRPRKRQPDTTVEAAEQFLDCFGVRVVSDE